MFALALLRAVFAIVPLTATEKGAVAHHWRGGSVRLLRSNRGSRRAKRARSETEEDFAVLSLSHQCSAMPLAVMRSLGGTLKSGLRPT